MKLDWLPDWKDKLAYPDPKKTSFRQWAWEFLRRNPEYQKDYAEWIALPEEVRFCGVQLDDVVYGIDLCTPPALPGETKRQWCFRVGQLGGGKCEPPYKCISKKYGFADFCFPASPYNPSPNLRFETTEVPSFLPFVQDKNYKLMNSLINDS